MPTRTIMIIPASHLLLTEIMIQQKMKKLPAQKMLQARTKKNQAARTKKMLQAARTKKNQTARKKKNQADRTKKKKRKLPARRKTIYIFSLSKNGKAVITTAGWMPWNISRNKPTSLYRVRLCAIGAATFATIFANAVDSVMVVCGIVPLNVKKMIGIMDTSTNAPYEINK